MEILMFFFSIFVIVVFFGFFLESFLGERMKEKNRKKEEEENMKKLKAAKTGQPITISKSYGVTGPNGEDDGKRFVRKEDAEEYLKRFSR